LLDSLWVACVDDVFVGRGFIDVCPPLDVTAPVLSCPPSVAALDDKAVAGEIVTFAVMATDDTDPAPTVVCVPPSGSLFPRGTTLVTCTATVASGNSSVCIPGGGLSTDTGRRFS
jgi:hypothetical protein